MLCSELQHRKAVVQLHEIPSSYSSCKTCATLKARARWRKHQSRLRPTSACELVTSNVRSSCRIPTTSSDSNEKTLPQKPRCKKQRTRHEFRRIRNIVDSSSSDSDETASPKPRRQFKSSLKQKAVLSSGNEVQVEPKADVWQSVPKNTEGTKVKLLKISDIVSRKPPRHYSFCHKTPQLFKFRRDVFSTEGSSADEAEHSPFLPQQPSHFVDPQVSCSSPLPNCGLKSTRVNVCQLEKMCYCELRKMSIQGRNLLANFVSTKNNFSLNASIANLSETAKWKSPNARKRLKRIIESDSSSDSSCGSEEKLENHTTQCSSGDCLRLQDVIQDRDSRNTDLVNKSQKFQRYSCSSDEGPEVIFEPDHIGSMVQVEEQPVLKPLLFKQNELVNNNLRHFAQKSTGKLSKKRQQQLNDMHGSDLPCEKLMNVKAVVGSDASKFYPASTSHRPKHFARKSTGKMAVSVMRFFAKKSTAGKPRRQENDNSLKLGHSHASQKKIGHPEQEQMNQNFFEQPVKANPYNSNMSNLESVILECADPVEVLSDACQTSESVSDIFDNSASPVTNEIEPDRITSETERSCTETKNANSLQSSEENDKKVVQLNTEKDEIDTCMDEESILLPDDLEEDQPVLRRIMYYKDPDYGILMNDMINWHNKLTLIKPRELTTTFMSDYAIVVSQQTAVRDISGDNKCDMSSAASENLQETALLNNSSSNNQESNAVLKLDDMHGPNLESSIGTQIQKFGEVLKQDDQQEINLQSSNSSNIQKSNEDLKQEDMFSKKEVIVIDSGEDCLVLSKVSNDNTVNKKVVGDVDDCRSVSSAISFEFLSDDFCEARDHDKNQKKLAHDIDEDLEQNDEKLVHAANEEDVSALSVFSKEEEIIVIDSDEDCLVLSQVFNDSAIKEELADAVDDCESVSSGISFEFLPDDFCEPNDEDEKKPADGTDEDVEQNDEKLMHAANEEDVNALSVLDQFKSHEHEKEKQEHPQETEDRIPKDSHLGMVNGYMSADVSSLHVANEEVVDFKLDQFKSTAREGSQEPSLENQNIDSPYEELLDCERRTSPLSFEDTLSQMLSDAVIGNSTNKFCEHDYSDKANIAKPKKNLDDVIHKITENNVQSTTTYLPQLPLSSHSPSRRQKINKQRAKEISDKISRCDESLEKHANKKKQKSVARKSRNQRMEKHEHHKATFSEKKWNITAKMPVKPAKNAEEKQFKKSSSEIGKHEEKVTCMLSAADAKSKENVAVTDVECSSRNKSRRVSHTSRFRENGFDTTKNGKATEYDSLCCSEVTQHKVHKNFELWKESQTRDSLKHLRDKDSRAVPDNAVKDTTKVNEINKVSSTTSLRFRKRKKWMVCNDQADVKTEKDVGLHDPRLCLPRQLQQQDKPPPSKKLCISKPFAQEVLNVYQQSSFRRRQPSDHHSKWTREHFLQPILHWNNLWLDQQLKCDTPPPDLLAKLHQTTICAITTHYHNIDDYISVFLPHLLHETWASMCQKRKDSKDPQKTAAVLLNCRDTTKQEGDVVLQGLISGKAKTAYSYPLTRDLVIAGLYVRMHGKNVKKNVFGYITRSNISTESNPELLARYPEDKRPELDTKYEISLKLRPDLQKILLHDGSLICLTKCDNLSASVRQLDALLVLNKSPLCRDILKPRLSTFTVKRTISPRSPLRRAKFNQSQMEMITGITDAVLEPEQIPKICMVQGPPGTGKTRAIIGLIHNIFAEASYRSVRKKPKILLCAPSNAAINELTMRFVSHQKSLAVKEKLTLVRVAKNEVVSDEVVDTLLDKHVKNLKKEKLSGRVASIDKDIEAIKNQIKILRKKNVLSGNYSNAKEVNRLNIQLVSLKRSKKDLLSSKKEDNRLQQEVLEKAEVICCTLNKCGNTVFAPMLSKHRNENQKFTCIIIDEATQTTELDCLIPLQFGMSKMVLVGDPEQLPATVLSQAAVNNNFRQSLFERFYNYFSNVDPGPGSSTNPIFLLDTQYRMDPQIAEFPSRHIYEGKLKSATKERPDCPLRSFTVLDILHSQEVGQDGSISNRAEAIVTALLCKNLRKLNVTIGIIVPYAAQWSMLKTMIKENEKVTISTVDGFQGQEKDIIILSCVRARSTTGTIGFLNCRRRLNVALTRAKHSLIVLGHMNSLMVDSDFKSLVVHAQEQCCYYVIPSDPANLEQVHEYVYKNKRKTSHPGNA